MNYTSIEQSKKLLKFGLSPESADMIHICSIIRGKENGFLDAIPKESILYAMHTTIEEKEKSIPCWSLATLIGVLPDTITSNDGIAFELNIKKNIIEYSNHSLYLIYRSVKADNLIDACVEMIELLHELNLL